MRNQSKVSRARRAQIMDEVHQLQATWRTQGSTVDQIQDQLLKFFPGELEVGEARMYAEGWTVRTVREGLRRLSMNDGLDAFGLDDTCVWRWLRGQVYPRDWMDRLCRLFQCHQTQLGWPPRGREVAVDYSPQGTGSTTSIAIHNRSIEFDTAGSHVKDWTAWFSVRLAQLLTLLDHWDLESHSCQPLQLLLHQEVLMFDALRPTGHDDRYELSRRQALITLVALPVALARSLHPSTASAALTTRFIADCAASITAAWHLLKQRDLLIIEQNLSTYLLALTTCARQPSRHQVEAARLASQAYRILGIVALHRQEFGTREFSFQQAVVYADIASDPTMQASALVSLGSTPLLYANDPLRATHIYQRALVHHDAIYPLQRSRVYAELAAAQAMQGQEHSALEYLEQAQLAYPDHPEQDPSFLYAEFTPASFILDRGLAYLALARHRPNGGYQRTAWDTFVELEQLSPDGSVPHRIHVEILNQQAATAVHMRDLDLFASYVQKGVTGALALQSDQRLHEALVVWRQAADAWPGERRVQALAELFADA